MINIREHNRRAWDQQVAQGNRWTVPVSHSEVEAARRGAWGIFMTPTKPVPKSWFPPLEGLDVLCLASGGGQQGPILAAVGANVTVFDNSPQQLARDRWVAEREGLAINTVEGDMRELSVFLDQSFGLIVHPVSNSFVPDVHPVWREAFRVLRAGGVLIAGFSNPMLYIFDDALWDQGILEVRHPLPYSDMESLSEKAKQQYAEEGRPLEFSHTLEDQIGGQLEAGFVIDGFYEDRDDEDKVLSRYMAAFIATRAVKQR
jgi:ubiquinone/menaquinone biosynthesis C-methylase UbiE